jgi:hypothetical protein
VLRSFAVSATQFHNEQYKHRKGVLHDHGTIYEYIKFVLAMAPVVSSHGKLSQHAHFLSAGTSQALFAGMQQLILVKIPPPLSVGNGLTSVQSKLQFSGLV